jgi:CRISPR-associated protein Csm5
MSVQNLKIRLHILSPVHIGCDDVYEPTNFVIDEKKNKLIEFDPMNFIKTLPQKEKEEFSKTCSGDNLLAIFKFIKRVYKPTIGGRDVDIATGLLAHYKKALDNKSTYNNKEVINQFSISRTAYNPQNNQPYIPGSSVKGSLRTAYLSSIANDKGVKDWWEKSRTKDKDKAKELEASLLNGKFETDPLRMVKVSDLLPDSVSTKIIYSVNRKKVKSDKPLLSDKGPQQIFESIQPGSIFSGVVSIDEPIKGAGIKSPIKSEVLLLASHRFYASVLKKEIEPIKTLGLKHQAGILANKYFEDEFKKTAFLIRIGRHSGAEAVTIENNRHIKIMQGKGKEPIFSKDGATTFWLASEEARPQNNNGLLPFGWAVMEIINA